MKDRGRKASPDETFMIAADGFALRWGMTLRALERDGLVVRTVFAQVPPRVEYALTGMGEKLNEATCTFWKWVERYAVKVEQARAAYDARAAYATPWQRPRPLKRRA